VGDGYTLRVADGLLVADGPQRLTVRLSCIDAPETSQAPYGDASRKYLQELAQVGSVVTIRSQTKDRYGRTAAEVFRNNRALNLVMVQSGQAFIHRKYLNAWNGEIFLADEAQAKQSRREVWAVSGGIERPWD
jgi:endonuclease YncB( thermonuclease family)